MMRVLDEEAAAASLDYEDDMAMRQLVDVWLAAVQAREALS